MMDARESMALADRIRPLLAGQNSDLQGAALAELLATWLAGHGIVGNPDETDRLRERLLRLHMDIVRKMIPVIAEGMSQRQVTE